MGKKFEEAHPAPETIVNGFQLMGLSQLLGAPGAHTCAEFRTSMIADRMEILCLPGNFNGDEVRALFKDAGLLAG